MHAKTVRFAAVGGAIALSAALVSSVARADALLSGMVTSSDGKPMAA